MFFPNTIYHAASSSNWQPCSWQGLDLDDLQGPFQPNHSMVLWSLRFLPIQPNPSQIFCGSMIFKVPSNPTQPFYGSMIFKVLSHPTQPFCGSMIFKVSSNPTQPFYGSTILKVPSNPTILRFCDLEDAFQSNSSMVLWSLRSFCKQRWTKGKTWAHFAEASALGAHGRAQGSLSTAQGPGHSDFGIIIIYIKWENSQLLWFVLT